MSHDCQHHFVALNEKCSKCGWIFVRHDSIWGWYETIAPSLDEGMRWIHEQINKDLKAKSTQNDQSAS